MIFPRPSIGHLLDFVEITKLLILKTICFNMIFRKITRQTRLDKSKIKFLI